MDKLEDLQNLKKLLPKNEEVKYVPRQPLQEKATLKEIYEVLKDGIDRIVIHESSKTKIEPDLDTRAALFLLNDYMVENPKDLYKIGSFYEIVSKGEESKKPINPKETIVHIDTGGREKPSIEQSDLEPSTKIFIDHHGKRRESPTSATQLVYTMLKEGGNLKEKPVWLDKFVSFITNVDNLKYLDKKDEQGKDQFFNEEIFRNEWPSSLYGLYKELPFDRIRKVFESGKDALKPFTKEEIENEEIFTTKNKKKFLKELINDASKKAHFTLKGVEKALNYIDKAKILRETPELGKVVYHNHLRFKSIEKVGGKMIEKIKTNIIPNDLGFIASKALGYDTYIVFNPQDNSFFLNNRNKDLEKVVERLSNIAPGTEIIRGNMVFPPKNKEMLKNMTEEKFLETLRLKK